MHCSNAFTQEKWLWETDLISSFSKSILSCIHSWLCPVSGSLLWRRSFWVSWRSSVRRSRTPAWFRAPSVSSWVWSSSEWRCIPSRTSRRLFNSCRYWWESECPGRYTKYSHSEQFTAQLCNLYQAIYSTLSDSYARVSLKVYVSML